MIVIVCGVSGAGKTTVGRLLAERLGCTFLDADDFHPPANIAKMAAGIPLNDDDREPWIARLASLLGDYRAANRDLVLACSALRRAHRQRLGVDQRHVITALLTGSPHLIAARLAQRRHAFMPASLLDSQLLALEPPTGGIVVDVSGTAEAVADAILEKLRSYPRPAAPIDT